MENPEVFNDINNEEELTAGQEADDSQAQEEAAPTPAELFKQELAQANDKYLRLYAEFDNFRRRTVKEREEARKTEGRDVIVAMLPGIG